jgi:hypothetical protein
MKIRCKQGYIAVYSKGLINLISKFKGLDGVKASAFFPLIIFKDKSFEVDRIVIHERIHFKQQIELLFIGAIVWRFTERFYLKAFQSKNSLDSYKLTSFEQEAYLNQENPNYLKERKAFAFVKYIKSKTNFEFDTSEPAKIKQL